YQTLCRYDAQCCVGYWWPCGLLRDYPLPWTPWRTFLVRVRRLLRTIRRRFCCKAWKQSRAYRLFLVCHLSSSVATLPQGQPPLQDVLPLRLPSQLTRAEVGYV